MSKDKRLRKKRADSKKKVDRSNALTDKTACSGILRDAICMWFIADFGAIAQLGERLLCKQEVVGSIPSGSTILSDN